jgi:hypothetical protein
MQYAIATEEGVPFDPDDVTLAEEKDILKYCDSLLKIFEDSQRFGWRSLQFTHLTVCFHPKH